MLRRTVLVGMLAMLIALVQCNPSLSPPEGSVPVATLPPAPPQPPATSATPAVDGAIWDDDAALPADAEDVVDYTLSASLDPGAHTVHGEGKITWRNASRVPATELWIHLYLNAFKNQKSVFLSEPVGRGGRGIQPVKDWGYIDVRKLALGGVDLWPSAELKRPGSEDETDARVPLPHPVAPGETITLDVVWDDKLPTVVERTGYDGSFHMIGQWFPKIARLEPDGTWAHFPFHHLAEFYADYGRYDVTLDVPAQFVIGATGPAAEARIDRGLRRIERHVQSNVHDFAWTAWDKFQTISEKIDGVDVTLLHPPGFRVVAERELRTMRFALPHFSKLYGKYPYSVLTLVHPPSGAGEAGGMEYPTLITTGGPWYTPPGVLTIEHVTIHEYGHQYFYGLLGSNEVDWPFLDEGLNTYAEGEGLGAWRGESSLVDLAGLSVSDANVQAVVGNDNAHDQPVAQPAYAYDNGSHYSALVYERTGAIFETFRRTYGDALVQKALGRYARKFRYKHPRPDDLIAIFDEVLGKKPAVLLRAALFDKAWADYAVTAISCRHVAPAAGVFDTKGKRETIVAGRPDESSWEGSVLVTRRGTLALPVDIELTLDDGTKQRVRWDGEGDGIRVPYSGALALKSAEIDPGHAILLDEKITNNFAAADASATHGAPRSAERTTYWAELFLQGFFP
jgi:hypothetical protein